LTVVFVVDQMRADYLARFGKEFSGGFARFVKDGAVFENARQAHVPTTTAVGHAAIGTGRFPAQHGIVGNEWWDRTLGRMRASVEDEEYGRSPLNLRDETFGDILKAVRPASKVISLSGKDRGAVLLGGRRPDLVLWFNKSAGQFVTDTYYGRMPDWVWDWDARLSIPLAERDGFMESPRFDALLLELAGKTVENERLGLGKGRSDLLFISLSGTDIIGHKKGPDSPEIREQLLGLDKSLGAFLFYLDGRLGEGRYLAVLTSDHGVTSMPESADGRSKGIRRILQSELEDEVEAALRKRLGEPGLLDRWLLGLRSPNVYLNKPLALEKGMDDRLLAEAADILGSLPAVLAVMRPEDLLAARAEKGPYEEIFRRSFYPARSGDLLVLLKENMLVAGLPGETSHSLPYDQDSRVPLVFMGEGIVPGRYPAQALGTDIAPTVSSFLEIPFEPAAGSRVLKEVLAEDALGAQSKRPS
jgi:predicted AlkP superfamily pyrophosphatase or phosphodiesterase